MTDPAVTYASYLKIDELLALQQPRSQGPEHDEMLFIVIHQVYELWFKELLHEFDRVRRLLDDEEPHRAQHTLKRILTILKVMVAQLDILETMTPLEFLSFRAAARGGERFSVRPVPADRVPARREVASSAIARFPEGSRARAALERRYQEPTLWDAFLRYLSREGYAVPPRASRTRCGRGRSNRRRRCSGSSSTVYRRDPKNAELCERLVDLDEGHPGVALPAREDGRADDRREERAPAARPARRICGKPSGVRFSRICGRSGRSCSTVDESRRALLPLSRRRAAAADRPLASGVAGRGVRRAAAGLARRGGARRRQMGTRGGAGRPRAGRGSGAC